MCPCQITLPWNGDWCLPFIFPFLITSRASSDVLHARVYSFLFSSKAFSVLRLGILSHSFTHKAYFPSQNKMQI